MEHERLADVDMTFVFGWAGNSADDEDEDDTVRTDNMEEGLIALC
jgi:hypothetical protein